MHGISRALALSCLLSAALATAARGQTLPDWAIDNFRWREALGPSRGISVTNKFGDIRIRGAADADVEVSAMIQRPASEPATAEVRIERRRGRLHIEVVYPAAAQPGKRRVDIAVFVPPDVPLVVRSRNGMFQGRDLKNDVELEGVKVAVSLKTTGRARVSLDEGDITATLELDGGPSRLVTRKGDISVRLPKTADAEVRIRAPGEISVQRPARIQQRSPRKSIVTLGQGHHRLTLKTRQGTVTLPAP